MAKKVLRRNAPMRYIELMDIGLYLEPYQKVIGTFIIIINSINGEVIKLIHGK